MIRVSPTSLVLILVCASAGFTLLCWLWSELQRARRESAARRNTLRCPLCFFEFHTDPPAPLLPCPRCGAPTAHEKSVPKTR